MLHAVTPSETHEMQLVFIRVNDDILRFFCWVWGTIEMDCAVVEGEL